MGRAKRILVVDDDGAVLACLRRLLGADYEVAVACGGPVALGQLDQFGPDLVIADELMPGMDGLELLDQVRRRRPCCRTMLLSGAQVPSEGLRSTVPPQVLCARKPWQNDELLVLVAAMLAEGR